MSLNLFRHFIKPILRADACRRSAVYSIIFLTGISSGSTILAAGSQNEALPLATEDFKAFVQRMAVETGGSDAVMASKLEAMGFTCIQKGRSEPLQCVRLGCDKTGGFLWRGALLQWQVFETWKGGGFSGSAMSYSWVKGCYPEKDRVKAQEQFWGRSD